MSSVIAGNFVKGVSFFGYTEGTTKGVAPHVRISVYKVFGSAVAKSFDIIAGIDQAIVDGVNVISISSYPINFIPMWHHPIPIASFSV